MSQLRSLRYAVRPHICGGTSKFLHFDGNNYQSLLLAAHEVTTNNAKTNFENPYANRSFDLDGLISEGWHRARPCTVEQLALGINPYVALYGKRHTCVDVRSTIAQHTARGAKNPAHWIGVVKFCEMRLAQQTLARIMVYINAEPLGTSSEASNSTT